VAAGLVRHDHIQVAALPAQRIKELIEKRADHARGVLEDRLAVHLEGIHLGRGG